MGRLQFQKGYPKIVKMASGHLSLELSGQVSFNGFPDYAELFLSTVGGIIKERNDSIIMCIWEVVINDCRYRLVYDDYPLGVFLESDNDRSDGELSRIKKMLEAVSLPPSGDNQGDE